MRTDRRSFLGALPAGAGLAFAMQRAAKVPSEDEERRAPVGPLYPTTDPESAREIVRVSHTDLERTTELVQARPELAKAAWDWGFGDWETALGAASHMGRPDIAQVLIEHGARPDLFTHAMLGHLEVVKAAIAASPGIQSIHGPHGITLLAHAKAGGEPAAAVVEWLEAHGDADARDPDLELDDEAKQAYLGKYVFHDGPQDFFVVETTRSGRLSIKRGDAPFGRVLNRVEEHGFAPAGAPSVRIRFRFQRGSVLGLTIHDPDPVVSARRLG